MSEKRPAENQGGNVPKRIPDNWDHEGNSKGSKSGPVRPTKDAYQGERNGKRG